jgi:hypothetical protein
MKTKCALLCILGLSTLSVATAPLPPTSPAALTEGGLTIVPRADGGEIEVKFKDQRVLLYAFASQQFKPYVKEIYTLKGDNLLLDAPSDHLHHHAMMYAITVNGHNFWEEAAAPGHQVSARPPLCTVRQGARGMPQALLSHRLYWVPHTNATATDARQAALLEEDRTLIVTVDEARQEVAVEWRADLKALSKVTLSGADYHGLGVRFIRSWDRVATHSNSENLPYPTQGKRDILEAKWSAVANRWNGREATLALFALPAQTRAPTKFFSMLDGFCYLSATEGLDKAPLAYAAGDTFSLRYLVTVYPVIKSREFMQERYQQWLKP